MNAKDAKKSAEEYLKKAEEEIPTVSGLTLAMGFKSRNELLNFDGNEKLKSVANSALLRLESVLESKLYNKETYHGAKTVLQSNFGWSDSPDDAKSQTINEVRRLLEGVGD